MKRFVLALTIACVLSGTVLAGDMHTTDSTEPAPPPPSPLVMVIITVIDVVTK